MEKIQQILLNKIWDKGVLIMKDILEQLVKIYNTLLMVSTKGEDTVIMGQCLSAMRESLTAFQQQLNALSSSEE